MNIACTMAPGRGDTDLLLARLAVRLAARGLKVRGTVQIDTPSGAGPCDMDVKVLPDGPIIRISQTLGRESRGCRLDPAGLERAVGLVEASIAGGADLLIVNKFGKQEASGRGFRDMIARAALHDIPVLVGLNGLNRDAFIEFAADASVVLSPTLHALERWMNDVRRMLPSQCTA